MCVYLCSASCPMNKPTHLSRTHFPRSFPEYKCLLANVTMANWLPYQSIGAAYVFDCRYHTNRPIFRQVGGSLYLSFHAPDYWKIWTDPFESPAYVWFQSNDMSYLPFDSILMPASYFNSARRAWFRVTANVLRVTCIEDNNY